MVEHQPDLQTAMRTAMRRSIALLALLLPASSAFAQEEGAPPVEVEVVGGQNSQLTVAVPAMPGMAVGRDISEVIASDFRSPGRFTPIGPGGIGTYSQDQAAAPGYGEWRSSGAGALVTGYAEPRADGRLTVACYLQNVTAGRLLPNQGFAVTQADWRRAAHKCADLVYSRLSGQGAFLDTRVVYVAETGPKTHRTKRIAIMDSDGSNHRYLTAGKATVTMPRFSPRGDRLVYTGMLARKPRVFVLDIASGRERLLVPGGALTFAPRFSPDGRRIVFSWANNGNTDIYVVNADGGVPQRLTSAPGVDTSPSYSPDGSRIVFESDRSGTQQLYVMGADGSGQRRISFGGGRYASPTWSPTGNLIAFTKIAGPFRIGVVSPSGGGGKNMNARRA